MTKAQLAAMARINSLSKGWPVGIATPKRMAERLVASGMAEWAPPAWRYPKPVFAVRLTTRGEVELRASQ